MRLSLHKIGRKWAEKPLGKLLLQESTDAQSYVLSDRGYKLTNAVNNVVESFGVEQSRSKAERADLSAPHHHVR